MLAKTWRTHALEFIDAILQVVDSLLIDAFFGLSFLVLDSNKVCRHLASGLSGDLSSPLSLARTAIDLDLEIHLLMVALILLKDQVLVSFLRA